MRKSPGFRPGLFLHQPLHQRGRIVRSEGTVHRVGQVVAHAGEDVRVGVEGYADVGVAQEFLHLLRVMPELEGSRSGRSRGSAYGERRTSWRSGGLTPPAWSSRSDGSSPVRTLG
jgi:hypothetical protein